MSRYVVNLEGTKKFVYGWDHALGYFYELWDESLGKEDEECLLEDKCSFINRMKNSEMLEAMESNGASIEHIEMVARDLPF